MRAGVRDRSKGRGEGRDRERRKRQCLSTWAVLILNFPLPARILDWGRQGGLFLCCSLLAQGSEDSLSPSCKLTNGSNGSEALQDQDLSSCPPKQDVGVMAAVPPLPVNAPQHGKRFSQGQQRPRKKNLGLQMFLWPWVSY